MSTEKYVYVETSRLYLRKFTQQDLDTFIAYRNDAQVAKYQSWTLPFTETDAFSFFNKYTNFELGVKGRWHQIALEKKENSEHIGDCGINTSPDGKQAEFGITIAREHQHQGYAFEALTGLFNHLFTKLHYHRIVSLVDAKNEHSLALMNKLGMRKEAYFKESYYTSKHWSDEVQFAILDREFCS